MPKLRKIFIGLLLVIITTSCASKRINLENRINLAETPSDLEELAQKYYETKDYRETIKVYTALIDRYSERTDRYEKQLAWAYYEIGFCHLIQKRYDEATENFKVVIEKFTLIAPRTLALQRLEEIQGVKSRFKNKSKVPNS